MRLLRVVYTFRPFTYNSVLVCFKNYLPFWEDVACSRSKLIDRKSNPNRSISIANQIAPSKCAKPVCMLASLTKLSTPRSEECSVRMFGEFLQNYSGSYRPLAVYYSSNTLYAFFSEHGNKKSKTPAITGFEGVRRMCGACTEPVRRALRAD